MLRQRAKVSGLLIYTILATVFIFLENNPYNQIRYEKFSQPILAAEAKRRFSFFGDLINRKSRNLEGNRIDEFEVARSLYQKIRPAAFENFSIYKPSTLTKIRPKELENIAKQAEREVIRLNYKPILNKTVFEGRPKVVLFVGIEGTGHHFVQRGFRVLIGDKKYARHFKGYSSLVRCKRHAKVFSKSSNLEALKKSILAYPSQVLFLNAVTGPTMQSYPNCMSTYHRVLREPDARHLAEMCEELGLDFQIVLLSRFPDSLLISTTIKRRNGINLEFQGPFYNYVLDILLAQLGSLDPKFVGGCINIEVNKTEAERLISPLRQRIGLTDKQMIGIFRHWSTQPRTFIDKTKMSSFWNQKMIEFYRKSVLLEQLCDKVKSEKYPS